MTPSIQLRVLFTGAVLACAALSATAQTSTTAPLGAGQIPAAVGVTPQAAAEANRQAVPRSDTATVVRTGPDAVDAAKSAASAAQSGTARQNTNASNPTRATGTSGTTMRPPKADRN